MTNLPRRRIDPLDPSPDSFDRVLATARGRRRRRGLIAASSTMVVAFIAAASFALGASLNPSNLVDPAGHSEPSDTPKSSPSPLPSQTRSGTSGQVTGGTVGANGGRAPTSWLRGQAVDASGNGIAGLFVLPVNTSGGGAAAVTDARGYYKIACPRAPVLLATWQINHRYPGQEVGGQWGATFVGSTNGAATVPKCDAPRSRTTLFPAATVTGQIVESGPCLRGDNYHLTLWLGGNKGTRIFLEGLYSGSTFSFSGLPAGTHTLGLRHQVRSVPVAPGTTVDANVYFACDGTTAVPTATTQQSVPPSPSPSPSPTQTPLPSPTPSEP
jgi:hypothetical protein